MPQLTPDFRDIPTAPCSCVWDGKKQTAICTGHVAIAHLVELHDQLRRQQVMVTTRMYPPTLDVENGTVLEQSEQPAEPGPWPRLHHLDEDRPVGDDSALCMHASFRHDGPCEPRATLNGKPLAILDHFGLAGHYVSEPDESAPGPNGWPAPAVDDPISGMHFHITRDGVAACGLALRARHAQTSTPARVTCPTCRSVVEQMREQGKLSGVAKLTSMHYWHEGKVPCILTLPPGHVFATRDRNEVTCAGCLHRIEEQHLGDKDDPDDLIAGTFYDGVTRKTPEEIGLSSAGRDVPNPTDELEQMADDVARFAERLREVHGFSWSEAFGMAATVFRSAAG